ncbi:MAG: arylesterase [Opitutae bacterium]|jgi:acyl-CoA thioesterase I|nr:arylesterase [Opitutae bacterium]
MLLPLLGVFLLLFFACGESKPIETNERSSKQTENQLPSFRILILGDSLTEGYGVSENEAYPSLLEEKLNKELSPKTKLRYKIVNGGISGATTSGGVSRIEWFLQSQPDYLLVALGGNDGLRGIPVEEMKKNIDRILQAARQSEIPTMLAGMKIPPNYGPEYSVAFAKVFEDLAEEHEVPLIPFLLEGVGGNPKLNLPDRIHPNALGHRTLCQTVYKSLVANLN